MDLCTTLSAQTPGGHPLKLVAVAVRPGSK